MKILPGSVGLIISNWQRKIPGIVQDIEINSGLPEGLALFSA